MLPENGRSTFDKDAAEKIKISQRSIKRIKKLIIGSLIKEPSIKWGKTMLKEQNFFG